MVQKTFQVNILGPDKPESVPLGELVEILSHLESSVLAYVRAEGVEVPSEAPAISLVDVFPGSEGLTFSVLDSVMPAVSAMSRNILEDSFVSFEAHREVFQLSEQLRSRGWAMAFVEDARNAIYPAELSATRRISPPPRPAEVKGSTTMLVRCMRVGGVQPRAEIRLKTGELLYPDVTAEIAKELGKRLYDEVVVQATATWRTDDWQVTDIRIDSASSFRKVDPVLAFKDLADAAQGRWEGVDAREYVEDLRAERPKRGRAL